MKNERYKDVVIDEVKFFDKGIKVEWRSETMGYGEITIVKHPDGEIIIDHEFMSKEFVKKVFSKLIETYYR